MPMPDRSTPALAKPNSGTMKKATGVSSACSSRCSGESGESGSPGVRTIGTVTSWNDARVFSSSLTMYNGSFYGFIAAAVDLDFYEIFLDTRPARDGLGVDGASAHTFEEHILVSSLVPRCRLFAELLRTLD